MALWFCLSHNYLKSDEGRWRKPKRPVQQVLLRLDKPAFHQSCPDCKEEDRIFKEFISQTSKRLIELRDSW